MTDITSTLPDPSEMKGSNAELIPPDAIVSSTLPIHNSSRRQFLEGASMGVKKIGSMIGLPGVSEVGGMMRDLVQTPDNNQMELASLKSHTKNMLMLTNSDCSSLHIMLAETTREIEAKQRRIDGLECDKRYLNADRARRKQEALEQLSREVSRLADLQTHIHLRMHNVTAQVIHLDANTHLGSLTEVEDDEIPEDKLPLVDLDMILDQEMEPGYTAVDRQYRYDEDTCDWICIAEDQALVTCSTGSLNGVRVLRKSYNSSDKAIATRFARIDLASLTKHIHPNVARLKGVTRDVHGQICEIVMTTAPLTLDVFLQRVVDPASLARFVRLTVLMKAAPNYHTVIDEVSHGAVQTPKNKRLDVCLRQGWMEGGVQLQVGYNGHVIAVPAEGVFKSVSLQYVDQSYYRTGNVSPLVEDVLKIYKDQLIHWFDPIHQPGLRCFTHRVLDLGLSCTLLDVLKIAADEAMGPPKSFNGIKLNKPPSVTFSAGDIGVMEDDYFVKILKRQPWTHERASSFHLFNARKLSPQVDGWSSSTLRPNITIQLWSEQVAPQTWESIRTTAKHLAKFHNVALSGLGQAHRLNVSLTIRHTKNMHKIAEEDTPTFDGAHTYCNERNCSLETSNWPYALYFHRRPTSRDCPREYWGFISTSPDPYQQCPEFPIGTDRVEYWVSYAFYRMNQDYRIRYEKMVDDGLQTMPGSFGG